MPWILKGGAALGTSLLGRKVGQSATSSAMARSPEELAALKGAQGAAGTLTSTATPLIQQGASQLSSAGNYWSTLLGGNRGAMAQATAGPRASLTDTYRGAERGLEHSGIRGAARDVASADLNRDRASKIAGLTTGVQPAAAQQLGGIGGQFLGTGAPLLQGAGGIYASLLGQGAANRTNAQAAGTNASAPFGRLLFDILSGMGKGKDKGPNGIFSGLTPEQILR